MGSLIFKYGLGWGQWLSVCLSFFYLVFIRLIGKVKGEMLDETIIKLNCKTDSIKYL